MRSCDIVTIGLYSYSARRSMKYVTPFIHATDNVARSTFSYVRTSGSWIKILITLATVNFIPFHSSDLDRASFRRQKYKSQSYRTSRDRGFLFHFSFNPRKLRGPTRSIREQPNSRDMAEEIIFNFREWRRRIEYIFGQAKFQEFLLRQTRWERKLENWTSH